VPVKAAPSVSAPSGLVVEKRETGAVEIWLDRPDRLNALGVELTDALHKAIEAATADKATALFIRARGRSFCSGADLKERRTMSEAQRYAHNRAINAAVNALDAASMPTIAVINGAAMGGGLELALACDIRIACESAQIGLTESRIGAIPGAGGTQRLPRLIGASQALFLMYAGETVSGRRAREIGLVNECVPDDALDQAAERYLEVLGSRSPAAARMLKKVVRDGLSVSLQDGLEVEHRALRAVFGSADYAEGLAAFAEKRPPRFAR
jgi:enoyl-CoA hydratase/carnithine racemase